MDQLSQYILIQLYYHIILYYDYKILIFCIIDSIDIVRKNYEKVIQDLLK